MNALELENEFAHLIVKRGNLHLLTASDTLRILDCCYEADVQFLGVEAFRLFDDAVQPAMDFSNVSFGIVDFKTKKFTAKTALQISWQNEPDIIGTTKDLVREGDRAGYSWFEVSISDPLSGDLLFFRLRANNT